MNDLDLEELTKVRLKYMNHLTYVMVNDCDDRGTDIKSTIEEVTKNIRNLDERAHLQLNAYWSDLRLRYIKNYENIQQFI